MTWSVITFDCAISTFAFGSGGRLISSACGFRNTVVHMKKMRSRNATSTIGVMSIFTPMRLGARFRIPPFFFFTPASGVSTAPMSLDSFGGALLVQRGLLAGHQFGDETERDRVGLLHDPHHVFHHAVLGLLVGLDGDAQPGILPPLLEHERLEVGNVRLLLGVLPHLPEEAAVLRDPEDEDVRLRNLEVGVAVRE